MTEKKTGGNEMTNEEKAIQILRTIRGCWIPPIGAVFSPIDCMQAMMAMTEWKVQQFKEYLEKKRDEYIDTHKEGDLLLDYASCIDRIINELSKEEQK